MDFGMKLQDLRKSKGLSQEALAERLNVSRQAVSKWESGAGYPEMDKLILLSDLFGVTIDYLIKDHSESVSETTNETEERHFMSKQKIANYKQHKIRFAYQIAISVSVIIMSVSIPILCEDTKYDSIGNFAFLAIIAMAVFCMIFTGIASGDHYSALEKKEINMSFDDLQTLQNEYAQFKLRYGMFIAFGVFLIIISVAAVTLFDDSSVFSDKLSSVQLMVCVALAVFLFISQSIKYAMYRFLVQNKEYIADNRREENSLYNITMPLAAMLFLILGFTKGWWHPGWIIFPITAIITSGIEGIRKSNRD